MPGSSSSGWGAAAAAGAAGRAAIGGWAGASYIGRRVASHANRTQVPLIAKVIIDAHNFVYTVLCIPSAAITRLGNWLIASPGTMTVLLFVVNALFWCLVLYFASVWNDEQPQDSRERRTLVPHSEAADLAEKAQPKQSASHSDLLADADEYIDVYTLQTNYERDPRENRFSRQTSSTRLSHSETKRGRSKVRNEVERSVSRKYECERKL